MARKESITPTAMVNKIRENQNNNKKLKSLFSSQFLGKMNVDELNGLKASIDKEIAKSQEKEVSGRIQYLESLGYKVSK